MASLNKVFLLGNLTRDPDLRGLPSGQSVCELGIAVSRRFIGANGQEVEDTCFVDVIVWGKTANNCKQYLTKGSQVMVEGRLQLDRWEDRNGGGQRSRLRVVAEQVQFMNRRPQSDNNPYNAEGGYAAPVQGNYAPQGQGNYPPPAQGGYQPRQGNYPPPRNDGYGDSNGGYDMNNYARSARPVPPPAAPPMPDPDMSGDTGADGGVDDIPF